MTPPWSRETRDAGAQILLALAAGAASLLGAVALLRAEAAALRRTTAAQDRGRPVVLAPDPPAPRLQEDPPRELAALRAREERELSAWGWADRRAGLAAIPIERAMELAAGARNAR